jgi:predicted transglutaminase-like cysteine proteinase
MKTDKIVAIGLKRLKTVVCHCGITDGERPLKETLPRNRNRDRHKPADRKTGYEMLKKIIAAAICGIAVASMSTHADAAGAAGFARGFAAVEKSAVTQIGISAPGGFDGCVLSAGQCVSTIAAPLTGERREELLRVNRDVNATMGALDDYFSGFAADVPATPSLSLGDCGDCAAIKRAALAGAGWSSSALRLAFSLNNDGSLEKVLIVTTDKGDIVLGNAVLSPAERETTL